MFFSHFLMAKQQFMKLKKFFMIIVEEFFQNNFKNHFQGRYYFQNLCHVACESYSEHPFLSWIFSKHLYISHVIIQIKNTKANAIILYKNLFKKLFNFLTYFKKMCEMKQNIISKNRIFIIPSIWNMFHILVLNQIWLAYLVWLESLW